MTIHKTDMLKMLWATVLEGKIELLESEELPEGTRMLVTLLPNDETEFCFQTSQTSLSSIWDNASMFSYSKNDLILVQYPFLDLSSSSDRSFVNYYFL